MANSLNSHFCRNLYSKRILRTSFREDNNTRRRSSTNVSVPNVTGLKRGGSGVPKRRRKRRNVTGWLMHKRLPDNGKAARRFIALRASTRQGCRCRASRWLIFGSLISLGRPIRGGHDWSSSLPWNFSLVTLPPFSSSVFFAQSIYIYIILIFNFFVLLNYSNLFKFIINLNIYIYY